MIDLDQVLEEVGDATSEPKPPEEGIPKQWVPHWIRVSIRLIVLPLALLDLSMQRLARKIVRPPFIQKGGCKRRGNCCHYIMIEQGRGVFGKLYHFWNTQINGFYLRAKEPHTYEGRQVHVMGCRYLKKDGSCGNYALRPLVCRKWPMIEHFGHPRILKGCGFEVGVREPKKEKGFSLSILDQDT
ncbi:MAG: YkgJ family cysteine cluster protein [Simkania sp.]|nr:YkgJ family cysteine cluster protein [Simkania sp.]